uniref:FREM1 protein n=1 Tax=Echinostoma caproni TaxID=27848 RepID=A0A183BEM6_9TREM
LELLLDLATLDTGDEDDLVLTTDNSHGEMPHLFMEVPRLPALLWTGLTTRKLGSLTPGQTKPVTLELIPTVTGLQTIPSLIIHELTMDRNYEFNDLGHVLVCVV